MKKFVVCIIGVALVLVATLIGVRVSNLDAATRNHVLTGVSDVEIMNHIMEDEGYTADRGYRGELDDFIYNHYVGFTVRHGDELVCSVLAPRARMTREILIGGNS